MKRCSMCKEYKEISEFDKRSDTKDKLQYGCKMCQKNRTDKYYKKNAKKIKKKNALKAGTKKLCNKCKTVKDIEEFQKKTISPDGVQNDCRECHNKSVHKPKVRRCRDRMPVGAVSLTQARRRNVHHINGCRNLFEFRQMMETV